MFVDRRNQTIPSMNTVEINCLQNQANGMAVVKALKFIESLQARFDSISAAEFDPEDNSFGFYFGSSGTEYWFGFYPECWAQLGSPFALQNRTLTKEDSRFRLQTDHEGTPLPGYWYFVRNIVSIDSIFAEIRAIIDPRLADPTPGE